MIWRVAPFAFVLALIVVVLAVHHNGKPIFYKQDAAEATRLQLVAHGVTPQFDVECETYPVSGHHGWRCSDELDNVSLSTPPECFVFAPSKLRLALDCSSQQTGEWHGSAEITP